MSPSPVVAVVDSVSENEDFLDVSSFVHSADNTLSPLTILTNNPVLLILNQHITISKHLFAKIWNNSSFKVCADGAINRLRDYDDTLIPDYLIGDLDSATQSNIDYYIARGTKLILQSSQYYTDFMKSIALINTHINYPTIIDNLANDVDDLEVQEELHSKSQDSAKDVNIVIIGGIGGRFDQTMSTINQIYNLSLKRPHLHFIIMNPEHTELVLFIPKGTTFVDYPKLTPQKELQIYGFNPSKSTDTLRNVGLLPILKESTVLTTKGLKWDVTNWSSSLSTRLSSSNLQVGTQGFIVSSTNPLFINLEL